MEQSAPIVIVGGGAAGLMTAIWSGRRGRPAVVLEGARTLGAKILVAGGGRCNVTHDVVDETSYAGSSANAIRKVLRRFDAQRTVEFFAELGVELKREETGKLFPVTDKARTVLDALLHAVNAAGSRVVYPQRVHAIEKDESGEGAKFRVTTQGADGPTTWLASRVVLATGGKSLPKSGSDGAGFEMVRALGHSVTPHLLQALVGLYVAEGCIVRLLSGVTLPVTLEVRSGTGKRLHARTASMLCTHFGISGPAPMDISRHLQFAQLGDDGAHLVMNWIPGADAGMLDQRLQSLGEKTVLREWRHDLPERVARLLCERAGVDPTTKGHELSKANRKELVKQTTEMRVPVTGTRGWNQAEATAGGVPLHEVHLDTMASRRCTGLQLCGEILDVDGRIGGYNFQWAWATGYLAGCANP